MRPVERKLAAVDTEIHDLAEGIKSVWAVAREQDREPTDDEARDVESNLRKIEHLKGERKKLEEQKSVEDKVYDLSKSFGRAEPVDGPSQGAKVVSEPPPTVGDIVINSAVYKSLVAGGIGGGEWKSGPIEIDTKGTVTTTGGTTVMTPPQFQPGIVPTLFQRLSVADLIATGTTDSPVIKYLEETTATNAAAVVAEGTAKPESTLAFTDRTDLVKKIATYMPVTDETLEDAPALRSYINQRLGYFIQQKEEDHLLNGTSVGIFQRSLSTYARGTVDDNALAIFKAMNGARGSFFVDPEGLIIHPTNWQAIRTAKDSQGQYYGGGPFYGPYGGPQGPASSNQFSADNLWGVPVIVTSAITVGTALFGPFRTGAQIFRKSGITLEATNSHGTYFTSDITTIRAEERLALAVYRPSAFVQVTGLA